MKNPGISIIFKFCVIIFITAACGSARDNAEDSLEYQKMAERINNMEFEIENNWATPLRYNRVNLMGNPNYIRFKGDSVNVVLPFFGVRHAGGYSGDASIIYKGLLENLKIEENRRKNEIKMFFQGSNKTEHMNFDITIYPNGRTKTYFSSSQRDGITYEGELQNKN